MPPWGMTKGLASHHGWSTSRMKPTLSSFLISSQMNFCRSTDYFQGFCWNGLALGKIFRWCSINFSPEEGDELKFLFVAQFPCDAGDLGGIRADLDGLQMYALIV
jgi:hypothetical protein